MENHWEVDSSLTHDLPTHMPICTPDMWVVHRHSCREIPIHIKYFFKKTVGKTSVTNCSRRKSQRRARPFNNNLFNTVYSLPFASLWQLNFFLKKNFFRFLVFYVWEFCLHGYLCTTHAGPWGGGEPLCECWIIKHGSFAMKASAFNHWANSSPAAKLLCLRNQGSHHPSQVEISINSGDAKVEMLTSLTYTSRLYATEVLQTI